MLSVSSRKINHFLLHKNALSPSSFIDTHPLLTIVLALLVEGELPGPA